MLPGFVQFSVAINARIIVFVNNLAWAKFILNTYTRDFNAVISNSGYNSLGGTFECVCYLFIDFFTQSLQSLVHPTDIKPNCDNHPLLTTPLMAS